MEYWKLICSRDHFLTKGHSDDWMGLIAQGGLKPKTPPMGQWIETVVEGATRGLRPKSKDSMALQVATSRGMLDYLAEQLLEKDLKDIRLSPHSTLGYLSSWPDSSNRLFARPLASFTSSTCSSFGSTLLNAFAYLRSHMVEYFVAAAIEAPCSKSTIRQMKAMKIYAPSSLEDYPCQAMNFSKISNSMVLSEAAHAFLLSFQKEGALAKITGVGSYKETPTSATGLSENALALQKAMEFSVAMAGGGPIDCVLGHFPGTVLGDKAEKNAYEIFFPSYSPYITGIKWKFGHSLGASMATGLEVALLSILLQELPPCPPFAPPTQRTERSVSKIMVNGLGFGGQAVSVILEKL
jgi:3-oxoacyl-(acyl-carrier-protein) synthase